MDEQVNDTLSSEPILWLPAATWFEFLARRLECLSDTQRYFSDHQDEISNYGILTGLISYMMQSVVFTPTMVASHVTESLGRLRYRSNVDHFGMFFLHDLHLDNLSNPIPELISNDNAAVMQQLGVSMRTRRKDAAIQQDRDTASEEYPIGKTPSWSEVRVCLRNEPWKLMKPWSLPDDVSAYGDAEEGSVEWTAAQLFTRFTLHIWAALNHGWKRLLVEDEMEDEFRAAVQSWTVRTVHDRVPQALFTPCNALLSGRIPGRKASSFSERRALYFVEAETDVPQLWQPMRDNPGYLGYYDELTKPMTTGEIVRLHECLERILDLCQCLPDSIRDESRGHLWKIKGGRVVILTNPRYYKVQRIGDGGASGVRQRRAPTHEGKVALTKKILAIAGFEPHIVNRAINLKKGLTKRAQKKKQSVKSRNRRKPPQRKKRVETTSSSSDGSGDKDPMGDANDGGRPGEIDDEEDCYAGDEEEEDVNGEDDEAGDDDSEED